MSTEALSASPAPSVEGSTAPEGAIRFLDPDVAKCSMSWLGSQIIPAYAGRPLCGRRFRRRHHRAAIEN